MNAVRKILVTSCCLSLPLFANGQNGEQAVALLKQATGVYARNIAYSYRVTLVNKQTKATLDRLDGKCFKHGAYYLDSNSAQLNMRDAIYTLQINSSNKSAYVKTLRNLEQKTGKKTDSTGGSLLDISFSQKKGTMNAVMTTNKAGDKVIILTFLYGDIRQITASVTPSNALKAMAIRSEIKAQGGEMLEKTIVMQDFSASVNDKQISTSRYLSGKDKSMHLKSPYTSYKLTILI